jgi:hypothetical protein
LGQQSSPYLQEKLVLLGSNEVFNFVPELIDSLLGIQISESEVYRTCQAVSEAIEDQTLHSPSAGLQELQSSPQEQVYGMIDGSMLFTDQGWQESKVGRVFQALPKADLTKAREWEIKHSQYVAKRGHYEAFTKEFERLLPPQSLCQKVFVTDGARWIGQWLDETYPDAIQILDFFHVCEKVAKVASWSDHPHWLEDMKGYLLKGQQLKVRQSILKMKRIPLQERDTLLTYLENNEHRMHYDLYRNKGFMIGSGLIESAHRTVLQVRMKRSGQRWSNLGCDNMTKLRVAFCSKKAELVTDIFRKQAA